MDAVLAGGMAETREDLPPEDLIRERIFTGLRRVAGVDLAEIESWSGADVRGRYAAVVDRLVREGLATLDATQLRLTERGLDLHSEAALRFF
jgi:coproporphyrinogen III oxidase-like Fe-S oxidoreductase